jgi:hypothetical protein
MFPLFLSEQKLRKLPLFVKRYFGVTSMGSLNNQDARESVRRDGGWVTENRVAAVEVA